MYKLLLAGAVLIAPLSPVVSPALARGPKPVPQGECVYDPDFDETTCYYTAQKECWAARRAFHRDGKATLSPCYFSTLGLWAVTYTE